MDNPKKRTEKKIGSTTYMVSSYCTDFKKAVVKNKLKSLIISEAAKMKKVL